MISLVCPIFNEEKYIAGFIESIIQQDFPKEEMEVLFVDGMSTDNTRNIIKSHSDKYPFIRLIDNPHHTTPHALNIGIKAANGDYIVRLDAHAEYPNDYLKSVIHYSKELPEAQNVGGVCITLPTNESNTAVAIAETLSCTFGMGNSYFRVGTDKIRLVDTVPFGCFKKDLFDKIGYFDHELIRNQDDEFNGRITNNGGKIYLIPSVKIKYFARDKISKVRKMFYQYGLYKPLVNKKLGAPATARQFFPLLFLLGIIVGGVISLFSNWIFYIYIAVLALYLLIGLCIGCRSAIKLNKPLLTILMPYVFLNIHLSYGFGYLVGIIKILGKKSFNVKSNR